MTSNRKFGGSVGARGPILLAIGLTLTRSAYAQDLPVAPAPVVATPIVLPTTPPFFSDAERASIIQYWNTPGRYEVGARLDAATAGPFVVRLTPEASTWFWNYNRAVRSSTAPLTKDPKPTDPKAQEWETWIDAKVKYDRAVAQLQADATNAQLRDAFAAAAIVAPPVTVPATPPAADAEGAVPPIATVPLPVTPLTPVVATAPLPPPAPAPAPLPPYPGPMPSNLQALVGNAPPFATSAMPRRHVIHFDTGETITYNDYLSPKNLRYGYFRFAQGVASEGTALTKLAPETLDQIFATGDMDPSEAHVMRAVSALEGGFDSINTYDTGYISVGFIQFAALKDGSGSLGDLLLYQKRHYPDAYAQDFRAFGIDVDAKGTLAVLDPDTGIELYGGEAVLKVVDDTRLTAVFHLAGMRSLTFRSAQLYVAKNNYYPTNLPVTVTVNGQTLTGKVGDVIHSEAGLATIFDRNVNTGNIRLLNKVLSDAMAKYNLTTLDQLLPYEREIITNMKWRHDYLKDTKLSQPN